MTTLAVIDASGKIVNRVVIDPAVVWTAEIGYTAIAEDGTPFEIGGTYVDGVYTPPVLPPPPPPPPPPQSILPQDLMAQFTAADAAAIQAAVAGSAQFWLLWSAMQAQKDPMVVTNARFRAGWNALVQVLGQARMDAIATALGVTVS